MMSPFQMQNVAYQMTECPQPSIVANSFPVPVAPGEPLVYYVDENEQVTKTFVIQRSD